jgi:uncharacterized protein YlxP (DUF503 family)
MANTFFVGRCELDLFIDNSHSLKEKRRIIKSIKERLKNQYNVAVCEYGDMSLWQRSQLGLVSCSNERTVVDATLKRAIDFLGHVRPVSLLHYEIEVF